ncbi:MAG: hypothetical protein BWY63_01349 [Chloroflexi bacterium ADurb.Bin360]|nr:MAG: hypothetical protein BWY63_01349 [Chloroflexi bacterium ADurb.Bin360]
MTHEALDSQRIGFDGVFPPRDSARYARCGCACLRRLAERRELCRELRVGGRIFRQCILRESRQQLLPHQIERGLHIGAAARQRQHRILLRQHHTELPKGAITAIGAVPAAPELKTITLRPIAIGIVPVGNLGARRRFHPGFRQQLYAIPASLLQIQLPKARDILGRHA